MKKNLNQVACCDNEIYHRPRVDIYESEEGLHLAVDLPGIGDKDLELSVEDRILTLKAPVSSRREGDPLRGEFQLRGFWRQFQLPKEVDQDKIQAKLTDGVLHLLIPQRAEAKPRRISITTK